MLLVIDIGNTNIVMGIFQGETLKAHWRLGTRRDKTQNEYGVLVKSLLDLEGIELPEIKGAIISSVVPNLTPILYQSFRLLLPLEPIVVGPGTKTGIPVLVDNPREVGTDRVVNAVAAYSKYGGPLVVVDFGTATTFDAISAKGEYLGGAIAPGIGISMEALFRETAQLPRVELRRPDRIIGKNTVDSIQSGVFFGYVALVDGMARAFKGELGGKPKVIATGGMAPIIAKTSEEIEQVDPWLTLEGLRILFQKNRLKRG
jgi:type III pantothenate kinase